MSLLPQSRPARAAAASGAIVLTLLLAYAAASAARGPSAAAQAAPAAPAAPTSTGVHVSGLGEVAGTPDVLRLDLAVEARGNTVGAALDAANTGARRVADALRRGGVRAADLRTTDLSVQPDYDYSKNGRRLRGYVVTNAMAATLRDLGTAGAVVSAAVSAGGDAVRVQGLRLDLEGDSALLEQARTKAFADARRKAMTYAAAAGRPLGAVTLVTEAVDRPEARRLDLAAFESQAAVPVQPGSQKVSVTVDVVWSFG